MGEPIKTFRDLQAWQKSIALVTQIYHNCKSFPKEETYGLTGQMRRSAVSIPSNLAEGYARRSRAEYSRFVQIAMGSLYEIQTQLVIASNLGYLDQIRFNELHEQTREIERMLSSLHQKLSRPKDSSTS